MCFAPNLMSFVGCEDGEEKWKFLGPAKNYDFMFHNVDISSTIQVPCGQCEECLAEKSRKWAERCALEAKKSKYNYFITLTYNDDNIPPQGVSTKEITNFMKRLRKNLPGQKIRFFGCGEYGSQTFRPHYHIILFNCLLSDLSEVFFEEKDGRLIAHRIGELDYRCQYSDIIHKSWQRKGNISVAPFSFATACYVAQYVTKKSSRDLKKFYKMFSCNKEFIQMSRRPGIGCDSVEDIDLENDYIICPGDGQAHICAVPRYFDKLIIKQKGEDWFNENIRSKRLEKKFQRNAGFLYSNYSHEAIWRYKAQRFRKLRKERQSL